MADIERKRVLTTQQMRALEAEKTKAGVDKSASVKSTKTNSKGQLNALTTDNNDKSAKIETGRNKKPRRKLKKQARRTFAGLFMASAIVVCAIPVSDVQAGVKNPDPGIHVKVVNYTDSSMTTYEDVDGVSAPDTWKSSVPFVKSTEQIYTTGSSSNNTNFQFAFMSPQGETDKVAIILGANVNNLPGGVLDIPQKVDGYLKYASTSSDNGYCAVNKDGQYMFYKKIDQVQRVVGGNKLYTIMDADGLILDSVQFDEVPQNYSSASYSVPRTNCDLDSPSDCKQTMSMKADGSYEYVINYYKEVYDPETTKWKWEHAEKTYPTQPTLEDKENFYPCFEDTYSYWKTIEDQNQGQDLFYYDVVMPATIDPEILSNFKQVASNADKGRINQVTVRYIGRQYLNPTDKGTWTVGDVVNETNPSKGVFANKGQITTLRIAANSIIGIGDYAFYGCTGLKGVELENGLSIIGNGAFMDCANMHSFVMNINSNISAIGEKAFYNCQALTNIAIPVNVRALGSQIFENCSALQYVDINGGGEQNVILESIGDNAFRNCKNLQELHFPINFTQKDASGTEINGYYASYLEGCIHLNKIIFDSDTFDLLETAHPSGVYDGSCTIGQFLATLPEAFYFEGNDTSAIHQTAKDHSASFKYAGEDKFEKVIYCNESPQHANTFIINSEHKLIGMSIDPDCHVIEIPGKIGNFDIDTIAANSFAYSCNIGKVVIPSSITTIEDNAFIGCHNLEDVVFVEPVNLTHIGQDAFATQKIMGSGKSCTRCGKTLAEEPYLSFTGTVSYDSLPFTYAMNPANKVNNDFQKDNTYITFYSPWPSNLTVKYDNETGMNTLINYPKAADLNRYAVKKYDGTDQSGYILFPAVTQEYIDEANSAVTKAPEDRTGAQNQIIDSAYNIVLPAGIEAIKDGIFSAVDRNGDPVDTAHGGYKNNEMTSITIDSIKEIQPYTFTDLAHFARFYQNNSVANEGYKIDDYAFCENDALNHVELGKAVTEVGLRPFKGCKILSDIYCQDGGHLDCTNQILYILDDQNYRDKIVECLEIRGTSVGNAQVGPDELEGCTEVWPEAFMHCPGIGQVDMSLTNIPKVPEKCFALNDSKLYSVKLPETCRSISKGAFWTTSMSYIEVPDSVSLIQPEAFADVKKNADGDEFEYTDASKTEPVIMHKDKDHQLITAYCVEGSGMDVYADDYYYINPKYYKPTIYHTVYFWDTYRSTTDPELITTQPVPDGESATPPPLPSHSGVTATGWTPNYTNIVRDTDVTTVYSDSLHTVWFQYLRMSDYTIVRLTDDQYVEDGKSATPPAQNPVNDGYVFKGWAPDYRNIYADGAITAIFEKPGDADKHTVYFYDYDGTLIDKREVEDGGSVKPPATPPRDGYKFIGWAPNVFDNITKDTTAVASYEKIPTSPSPAPNPSGSPKASGSPSASPSPSPNNNNNVPDVKTFTCTVSGGSGSGTYIAGQVVPINAYDMGANQVFDRWTSSTANVAFGNPENANTYFVMPANNVAITATYKAGSGNKDNSNNNSGNNASNKPSNNGNTGRTDNPSGTKVDISKGGMSRDDVAGATVTGSTDNFIVKVTDDKTASDLALTALQNKYGDISKIKYLPMDISLYDSTGRTKITDTSGMSVALTLPLPDDLATYAGNNKIASVSGGVIEDLNSRFTTVDGVPCINFTATHFSPYVIYVDTANLTEKTIDYTPKTGDPIHPKWFLAIGLGAIGLILFFKRDKKNNTKMA